MLKPLAKEGPNEMQRAIKDLGVVMDNLSLPPLQACIVSTVIFLFRRHSFQLTVQPFSNYTETALGVAQPDSDAPGEHLL